MTATLIVVAALVSSALAATQQLKVVTPACEAAYSDFFNYAVQPCFWDDNVLLSYAHFGELVGRVLSENITTEEMSTFQTMFPQACGTLSMCLNTPNPLFANKTALDAVDAFAHHCASQRSRLPRGAVAPPRPTWFAVHFVNDLICRVDQDGQPKLEEILKARMASEISGRVDQERPALEEYHELYAMVTPRGKRILNEVSVKSAQLSRSQVKEFQKRMGMLEMQLQVLDQLLNQYSGSDTNIMFVLQAIRDVGKLPPIVHNGTTGDMHHGPEYGPNEQMLLGMPISTIQYALNVPITEDQWKRFVLGQMYVSEFMTLFNGTIPVDRFRVLLQDNTITEESVLSHLIPDYTSNLKKREHTGDLFQNSTMYNGSFDGNYTNYPNGTYHGDITEFEEMMKNLFHFMSEFLAHLFHGILTPEFIHGALTGTLPMNMSHPFFPNGSLPMNMTQSPMNMTHLLDPKMLEMLMAGMNNNTSFNATQWVEEFSKLMASPPFMNNMDFLGQYDTDFMRAREIIGVNFTYTQYTRFLMGNITYEEVNTVFKGSIPYDKIARAANQTVTDMFYYIETLGKSGPVLERYAVTYLVESIFAPMFNIDPNVPFVPRTDGFDLYGSVMVRLHTDLNALTSYLRDPTSLRKLGLEPFMGKLCDIEDTEMQHAFYWFQKLFASARVRAMMWYDAAMSRGWYPRWKETGKALDSLRVRVKNGTATDLIAVAKNQVDIWVNGKQLLCGFRL